MKELNLPFWIGMDYEKMEFDLEILSDRIQGYDGYIYLGEFNNFLNYTTDKIELLFRMDVLEGIVISYNNLPFTASEDIIAKLESKLGRPQIVNESKYKLHKFITDKNDLLLYVSQNGIYIVLCNYNIIYFLHLSLLCCHF